MTRILRIGIATAVALALASRGWPAAADPTTPQLSPLHRQREDAQRLNEHHRSLDAVPPADPTGLPPPVVKSPVTTRHTTRGAGLIFLGVAGISAAVAVPLFAADTSAQDESQSYGTFAKTFITISVISAVTGIGLLASDRTVRVAPTVSSRAVGLAIMGRL